MKINIKIAIFSSSFLVVLVISLALFGITGIQKRAELDLQSFNDSALVDIKQNLKNLVDVAYEAIDQNYTNLQDKKYLEKYYGRRLTNTIDIVESILERYAENVKSGTLSKEAAQKEALAIINKIRYDGGTGYIWVNDTSLPIPRMIMHPTIPSLNGQVLDDPKFNTALGVDKNLFQAFNQITRHNGEGFIDYTWPKPTPQGLVPDVQKLSYVRLFKEWNWIIGTGIYIDDARADILNKIKRDVGAMRYADGTGYFWINDATRPYPKMVMHPTAPDLNGKTLDDEKYNNALGKEKNLFKAFVDVTEATGEGYVDYLWAKPTADGLTDKQPKLSYVKLHKPLGWIIGTGVYIDTVDAAVAKKKEKLSQQIQKLVKNIVTIATVGIFIAIFISFIFAHTLSKPLINLTRITQNISLGKNLDDPIIETTRDDEIGTLAQAIDRLKVSVKIMMGRLKK